MSGSKDEWVVEVWDVVKGRKVVEVWVVSSSPNRPLSPWLVVVAVGEEESRRRGEEASGFGGQRY